MESKRVQTAKKYISHFATLDAELLASVLSENHVHQFAPSSVNAPGPFTKQGFIDYGARLRRVMTGFPVYAKEYVESEKANQVTVWATAKPQFKEQVMGDSGVGEEGKGKWEYEGEYVFMLWMDESGEKIKKTVEFLDSKATVDVLMPLLKTANEKLGSQD